MSAANHTAPACWFDQVVIKPTSRLTRNLPASFPQLNRLTMSITTPMFPGYVPQTADLPLKLFRNAFKPISPPPLPVLTLRIPVRITRSPKRAHLPYHYPLILPSSLLNALKRMSLLHSELTNASNLMASVKVVRGTPCTKWHVDKVPLRGLCTLYGPGSVIMTDESPGRIELEPGDLVFLPGSGYHNNRRGVVHKSPHIEDDEMRLVLQTDCVKEG